MAEKVPYRVEIRADPLTGRDAIYVMGFDGWNLYDALTTPNGEKITAFSGGTNTVRVNNPRVHLFLLEELRHGTFDGPAYDRKPAFGIDERYELETRQITDPSGLELLLEAFKDRSLELQNNARHAHDLRYFFPLIILNTKYNTLTGVLWSSKTIPPRVVEELRRSQEYSEFKKHRTLHGDIKQDEKLTANGSGISSESRYVTSNRSYKAFAPFSSSAPHSVQIFPKNDFASFNDIDKGHMRDLAEIMQNCFSRYVAARGQIRFLNVIYAAIHSIPVSRNGEGSPELIPYVNAPYQFHVEMSPGIIPPPGAPFEAPFTGWMINDGRPKEMAELLRSVKPPT